LKDKVEGFGWVAVVKLEEVREGFALLGGNDGEQGVACERQIESGPWSSVPVFLPGGGVAFVMVAILDAPVFASGLGGTGFFFPPQAGEEDAGVAFGRLRFFLFAPGPQPVLPPVGFLRPSPVLRRMRHLHFGNS